MLLGTGIDIVEISRIKKAIEQTPFAKKFFTLSEQNYCEARKSHKFASYAARFAAKEALVKAFGTGFRKGDFTDISIENDELGCPYILLSGYYLDMMKSKKVEKIHVSLSHCRNLAVAQVVLEGQ